MTTRGNAKTYIFAEEGQSQSISYELDKLGLAYASLAGFPLAAQGSLKKSLGRAEERKQSLDAVCGTLLFSFPFA